MKNFPTKEQFLKFAKFYSEFIGDFTGGELFYNAMVSYFAAMDDYKSIMEEEPVAMLQLPPVQLTEEEIDATRFRQLAPKSDIVEAMELAFRNRNPTNRELMLTIIESLRNKKEYFTIPDIYNVLEEEMTIAPSYNTVRYYVVLFSKFIGIKPKEATKIYE